MVVRTNDKTRFRTRLNLRNWNRTNVTELDEHLKPLPRFEDGQIPGVAPITGQMVQWLDRESWVTRVDGSAKKKTDARIDERIGQLLDLYNLPFVPSMFLYEKKAIYLRFIGASRALMHRVLDEQPGLSGCQERAEAGVRLEQQAEEFDKVSLQIFDQPDACFCSFLAP